MLQYMRKYRLAAYALIGALSIVLLVIATLIMGQNTLGTPWGWVIVFGAFIVSNLLVSYVMGRVAEKNTQKLTDIFDKDCDPRMLIEQGHDLAQQVLKRVPFNEWGTWYLSAYSSALIDQRRTEEAGRYVVEMTRSIQLTQNPLQRFGLLINAYTPIKELYGLETAEDFLTMAEALVSGDPRIAKHEGAGFVRWARLMLDAEKTGDEESLLDLYGKIVMDDNQSPRMRVWAACKASFVYEYQGDELGERGMLRFVIERGNTMGCVEDAKLRLIRLHNEEVAADAPVS